ncbi:MAG: hypothetical protein ACP5RN_02495 [Armatimonadota bacterium]
MRTLQVQEIRCKRLLHRTGASFAEFTLNPYIGCGFGCSYCYVPVLRAKRGQEGADTATWAWCPFLPGVENTPEQIRRYVQTAAQVGVREIWVGRINYWSFLEERYKALLRQYRAETGRTPRLLMREQTEQLVKEECEKAGIVCRI